MRFEVTFLFQRTDGECGDVDIPTESQDFWCFPNRGATTAFGVACVSEDDLLDFPISVLVVDGRRVRRIELASTTGSAHPVDSGRPTNLQFIRSLVIGLFPVRAHSASGASADEPMVVDGGCCNFVMRLFSFAHRPWF